MRSRIVVALAALAVASAFAAPARAELLISIDKSAQQMTVAVDGRTRYVWPVSTGAPGYDTPSGQFKPFRMEADHFSKEWDDAPMPHSIFFTMQGHAIHGSSHVKAIGTPASHGCVRLEPKNAAVLFALVKQEKMANTHVVLTGETPTTAGVPVARRDNQRGTNNDYQRAFRNDPELDSTASVPQPRQRTVRTREYDDGQRYYYDRESPYYTAPRRYGDEQQPFGWPFGR
ncbi:MAG TPA: L,D-transpeptidase [Pseudolabrys sp.]|nr:L,D-transpeptidase [Pseudolabrys sp.]